MDVFGQLKIEVYQNPEEFLESNPEAEDQLVDVAQSAFTKEGVPTDSDAEDHLRVPLLVTAKNNEGDYVAFSGLSRMDDTIYEVGLAVDRDLQGRCVGRTLLSRGVMEMADGDEVFGYRTQNPNMYACADNCFEVYPQPETETPDSVEKQIESLGEEIDPGKQMGGPIMREAYADIYDGGMYSEIPENEEFHSFMYGDDQLGMSFEDGDALVVAGEISEREAAHSLGRAARKSDYKFIEEDEKIA